MWVGEAMDVAARDRLGGWCASCGWEHCVSGGGAVSGGRLCARVGMEGGGISVEER